VAREWTEGEWENILEQLRTDGTVEAEGVFLDAPSVKRLLAVAPRVNGKPHFTVARFDGAIFGDRVRFDEATFGNRARFDEATFGYLTSFDEATFGEGAVFREATFGDRASFDRAIFGDGVSFRGAIFGVRAGFGAATFGDRACFLRAIFGDGVSFRGAIFGEVAEFRGATFGDEAQFGWTTFGEEADFRGATFHRVGFTRATFGDGAHFAEATFGDRTHFAEATFGARAFFRGATFGNGAFIYLASFGDQAGFGEVTFGDGAFFDGATFGDGASFDGATFGVRAAFNEATFGDRAAFNGAIFGDRAAFNGATFGDRAHFSEVTFGRSTVFTAVLVTGHLVLNGEFGEASRLDLTAQAVWARLILPAGGTIRVRWAKIYLEESAFPQPTILAPLPETSCSPAEAIALALFPRSENYLARPSVMSLRWANLAGLVIGENVSLAGCQFQGAHNLDKVRFEGRTEFARAPHRFGGRGRQALAEEHRWRAAVRKENGWFAAPEWAADTPEPLRPATIATLYRGLRKGREDSKDEPGAADFYYGEMEMRRFSTRWRAERLMLTVYWLSCGYALRAQRAFACLAALLVVGALLFTTVGFDQSPVPVTRPDRLTPSGDLHYTTVMTPAPSHTLIDGLEFAVDTSTSLLHTRSDRPLTGSGRITELGLRFAGPLLLGLALLSLRGRVKRWGRRLA
jgi:uncharacterized protein YjbI with pentapeptide repeats